MEWTPGEIALNTSPPRIPAAFLIVRNATGGDDGTTSRLATVSTNAGIALTAGKRLTGRFGGSKLFERPLFCRLATALPVISAVGTTLAGRRSRISGGSSRAC